VSDSPVKQHFIPQFLLRNFATGKKNKARPWVFDKAKGRAFSSSQRVTPGMKTNSTQPQILTESTSPANA
jgi:hypothetical protein